MRNKPAAFLKAFAMLEANGLNFPSVHAILIDILNISIFAANHKSQTLRRIDQGEASTSDSPVPSYANGNEIFYGVFSFTINLKRRLATCSFQRHPYP
jgi:hypothetical protein